VGALKKAHPDNLGWAFAVTFQERNTRGTMRHPWAVVRFCFFSMQLTVRMISLTLISDSDNKKPFAFFWKGR
jgi:hypothetical protein